MDDERGRLESIMRDLAAGDGAAAVRLYVEFGGRIAPMIRRRLTELGVYRPAPDEVNGLVIDACFEIQDCASGWDPARGALPWTWAARRINAKVAKWVGIYTDPLDEGFADWAEERTPGAAHDDDGAASDLLDRLAGSHAAARVLREAFTAARVSDRDRRISLEYALQRHLGDASPASTVGQMFGVRPDHARQIVKRARDRVARVVAQDGRFAELRDLPLLRP
jgi:hypothetical protein